MKLNVNSVKNAVGVPTNIPEVGYNQLREAITERLGGPFDYAAFQEDLQDCLTDLEAIKREHKNQALL